jgi:UDP-galactopyranose mutase
MRFDVVIVGAGLTGVTLAERFANVDGKSVLLIEARDHVAGNAWDEYNEHGILEHRYGPHIFHTNSGTVWQYLSQYTEWYPYVHKVHAWIEGRHVPLPFNLNSIDLIFPPALASTLSRKLVEHYGYGARVPILKLRQESDADLHFLAQFVYSNVFEQYTKKQWGLTPEELSPSVTARVPIVVSRDDRYFHDCYQAMPSRGYGEMVRRMLKTPRIHTLLNTRWESIRDTIAFDRLYFTGPIDEFFDFQFGRLPYRSLIFQTRTLNVERAQHAAVINYPNDYNWTRITEMKWLTGQQHPGTTLITEYPVPFIPGENLPYYPIPTDENRSTFKQYEQAASTLPNVTFAGRLAEYIYYNMDQAIARALKLHATANLS